MVAKVNRDEGASRRLPTLICLGSTEHGDSRASFILPSRVLNPGGLTPVRIGYVYK